MKLAGELKEIIAVADGLEIGLIRIDPGGIQERVQPGEEFDLYTLFAHMADGGTQDIADFASATSARVFAYDLMRAAPHLLKFGLADDSR